MHISWTKPRLERETDEYFENDYTKQFFKHRLDHEFKTRSLLLRFLAGGALKPLSFGYLRRHAGDNLTLGGTDFEHELRNTQYAANYERMLNTIQTEGKLVLPAPILIEYETSQGTPLYYGFAGNRRMNLAWHLGLEVVFWIVPTRTHRPLLAWIKTSNPMKVP